MALRNSLFVNNVTLTPTGERVCKCCVGITEVTLGHLIDSVLTLPVIMHYIIFMFLGKAKYMIKSIHIIV